MWYEIRTISKVNNSFNLNNNTQYKCNPLLFVLLSGVLLIILGVKLGEYNCGNYNKNIYKLNKTTLKAEIQSDFNENEWENNLSFNLA